jgi:hypothetical protein
LAIFASFKKELQLVRTKVVMAKRLIFPPPPSIDRIARGLARPPFLCVKMSPSGRIIIALRNPSSSVTDLVDKNARATDRTTKIIRDI